MNQSIAGVQSRAAARSVFIQTRHRLIIMVCVAAGIAVVGAVLAHGWDYYILGQMQRPFSPKHSQLRPSGTVGLRLGMIGFALFALVYLYPLRKRWPWLLRIGNTRHWLDYHIVLGLVAPAIITLHSSFKFQGLAGMAFWTMIALTTSGIVGRYIYAQIPKSLGAAEISLKGLEDSRSRLNRRLNSQDAIPVSLVDRLFRLPDLGNVQKMPLIVAMLWIASFDIARPFRIWKVRRYGAGNPLWTLWGMVRTRNEELERTIDIVRKQSSLSKKILFLSKTQRVFLLWHVIHRPFSVTFAILVLIHVIVVVLLGYF